MNKKITGFLAILLSLIMVVSTPISILASDELTETPLSAGEEAEDTAELAQSVEEIVEVAKSAEETVEIVQSAEEAVENAQPAEEAVENAQLAEETVENAQLAEETTALADYLEESSVDSVARTSDYLEIEPEVEVNPLYADSIDPEDYVFEEASGELSDEELVGRSEVPAAKTVEEFCENYRAAFDGMVVSHNYRCSAVYECAEAANYTDDEMNALMEELIGKAKANQFIHSGVPTAGDYAKWNYATLSTGAYCERDSVPMITVYTSMAYFITEEMEDEMTVKFEEVMRSLNLDTMTEYGKIKTIYDYITTHVTYDWYHFRKQYDLKFSAYAALVNGTAVCQGYASLFYRMALAAGLDARLIYGDGQEWDHDTYEGENHGWNIVRLHDLYYNLDPTRDADYGPGKYKFFLKTNNKVDFEYHIRAPELDTAEFHAKYPMAATNYEVVDSDLDTVTSEAVDLSNCTVTVTPESCRYNGSERKPDVTVMSGETRLIFGTDYTVSYKNNINIGTATVTVTGKGKCSGEVSRTFEIERGEPTVTFAKENVSKSMLDAAFTNELTLATDGTVTFKSSDEKVATVDSASGEVTLKGFGTAKITASVTAGTNYMEGSAYYTLTVKPIGIENAVVSGVSLSYGYTGRAYTPACTVKVREVTLAEGTDYTIKYENNQEPGTATITITGMGNYTGTKIKRFKIVDCVSALESGKTYQIIPKNNIKMAVCSYCGRMVNNTKVYITNRSASEAMRFKAVRNADGTWKLINAKSELAFAVQQNNSAVGKGLVLYEQTTRKAQNWRMVRKADNSFAIINSVSGLYVAMSDSSPVKGTTLSMQNNSGRCEQRFYFVEAEEVDALYDGTYGVKAAKNKAFGLNVALGSKEEGANVNLYKYSDNKGKRFKVMYSGGGFYRLVNVNSGLVLSVEGNTKRNGANVVQSKWQAQSGQRWKIAENEDGTVTFTNALGTVLQLSRNETANGSNVVARKAAATTAQRWWVE